MNAVEPMIETEFVSESEIKVTVYLDHLSPIRSTGDTQEASNGSVQIDFFKQAFSLTAQVHRNDGRTKNYKLKVVRLPSRIKSHHWKLVPGLVHITLIKKEEVAEDGSMSYVDWGPIVRARGLDQYDSSEDEEGNVPASISFNRASDRLEELGLNIVHGQHNEFEIDEEDLDELDK